MGRVSPKKQVTFRAKDKKARDARALARATESESIRARAAVPTPPIIEPIEDVVPAVVTPDLTSMATNVQTIVNNVQVITQSFSDVLEIMSDAAASAALAAFKDPVTYYSSSDTSPPVEHKNIIEAITIDAGTFSCPETLSVFAQKTVENRAIKQMFWDKKTRSIVAVYVDYFSDSSFKATLNIYSEKTIIYGMFHRFMTNTNGASIDIVATAEGFYAAV